MQEPEIKIDITFLTEGEYLFKIEVPSPFAAPKDDVERLPVHNAPTDAAGLKTLSISEVETGVF